MNMPESLRVVLIEPYYGGSHAAFVAEVERLSRHAVTTVTLPARKWKWRMRGAAIWVTRDQCDWISGATGGGVDAILCSDMLNVADLRALLPASIRNIPIVVYFHENQLTYPIPDEDDRDYQYGMTNITSCLAADAVWFNSRFHAEAFLGAVERLLRKMPDFVPADVTREIRAKSLVISPPVADIHSDRPPRMADQPVTILWCHRWEYDKNPEPFFDALIRLDQAGAVFDLVLVGEQFRTAPAVFAESWPSLQPHFIHAGFVPDRSEYLALVKRCDIVVSTAIQENFGIAVAEAILAGCQPLLPNRLAYPELIPEEFHDSCLYSSDAVLYDRLQYLIDGTGRMNSTRLTELREATESRFGAEHIVQRIDEELGSVVRRVRS